MLCAAGVGGEPPHQLPAGPDVVPQGCSPWPQAAALGSALPARAALALSRNRLLPKQCCRVQEEAATPGQPGGCTRPPHRSFPALGGLVPRCRGRRAGGAGFHPGWVLLSRCQQPRWK